MLDVPAEIGRNYDPEKPESREEAAKYLLRAAEIQTVINSEMRRYHHLAELAEVLDLYGIDSEDITCPPTEEEQASSRHYLWGRRALAEQKIDKHHSALSSELTEAAVAELITKAQADKIVELVEKARQREDIPWSADEFKDGMISIDMSMPNGSTIPVVVSINGVNTVSIRIHDGRFGRYPSVGPAIASTKYNPREEPLETMSAQLESKILYQVGSVRSALNATFSTDPGLTVKEFGQHSVRRAIAQRYLGQSPDGKNISTGFSETDRILEYLLALSDLTDEEKLNVVIDPGARGVFVAKTQLDLLTRALELVANGEGKVFGPEQE